jgi:hypothetical protein
MEYRKERQKSTEQFIMDTLEQSEKLKQD